MKQFILLFSLCLALPAFAAINDYEYDFESEAERARYQSLTLTLRCPKCQNQSISDSDAPIAGDMRRKTFALMEEGMSDEEITAYWVKRYGEFVQYKTPFNWNTLLVWLVPIGIALSFLALAIRVIRRHQGQSEQMATGTDSSIVLSEKAKQILEEDQ